MKARLSKQAKAIETALTRLTSKGLIIQYEERLSTKNKKIKEINSNEDVYNELWRLGKGVNLNDRPKAIYELIHSNENKVEVISKNKVKLEKMLDEAEAQIKRELAQKLKEIESQFSKGDWKSEVENIKKQQEKIKEYKEYFSKDSSILVEIKQQSDDLENTKRGKETYGPFDVAFADLLSKSQKGKLLEIEKFEKEFSKADYPKRSDDYVQLEIMKAKINKELREKLEENLNNMQDNDSLTYQRRKNLSENRKKEIYEILKEYPSQHPQYQKLSERLKKEQELLDSKLTPYSILEKECQEKMELVNRSDLIVQGNEFIYKQKDKNSEVEKILKQLSEKIDLSIKLEIKEFNQDYDSYLRKRLEEPSYSRKIALTKKQIANSGELLKVFPEHSESYKLVKQKYNEEQSWLDNHKDYPEMEAALQELKLKPDQTKLQEIEKFLITYPFKNYKDAKDQYEEIHQKAKKLLESLNNEVTKIEREYNKNTQNQMANKIALTEDKIERLKFIVNTSPNDSVNFTADLKAIKEESFAEEIFEKISKVISDEKIWISNHRKYILLEEKYNKLISITNEKEFLSNCEEFLHSFSNKDYIEAQETIDQINNLRINIQKKHSTQFDEQYKLLLDDKNIYSYEKRIELANKRIKLIQVERSIYANDTQKIKELQESEDSENKLIQNLERYIAFHIDINKIKSLEGKDKLEMISKFEKKYSKKVFPETQNEFDAIQRIKDDFFFKLDETINEIKTQEDDKTLTITDKLKVINLKISDIETRINLEIPTDFETYKRQELEKKIKEFDKWRVNDQKYKEYKKLEEDYIGFNNIVKEKVIIKWSEFNEKYKEFDYPLAEALINGLKNKYEDRNRELKELFDQAQKQNEIRENESFQNNLNVIDKRIKIYERLLEEIPEKFREYKEYEYIFKAREVDNQLKSKYEKLYIPFEEGYESLVISNDEKKLVRIASFLKNFKRVKYLDEQGIGADAKISNYYGELYKKQKELVDSLKEKFEELEEKSKKIRDENSQPTQKTKAKINALTELNQRISDEIISQLSDDGLLKKEMQAKLDSNQKWIANNSKYVEFEEQYDTLRNQADERFLIEEQTFTTKFKQSDYEDKEQEFKAITEKKGKVHKSLKEKLEKELADQAKQNKLDKLSESSSTELELLRKYWADRANIYKEYLKYYPNESSDTQDLILKSKEANEKAKKYFLINNIKSDFDEIVHMAKVQKNNPEVIIDEIKKFWIRFKDMKDHKNGEQIVSFQNKVLKIQNETERKIHESLKKELDKIEGGENKPNIIKINRKKIEKIRVTLPKFIKDSDYYKLNEIVLNDLIKESSEQERRESFRNSYKELLPKLAENLTNQQKINLLKEFKLQFREEFYKKLVDQEYADIDKEINRLSQFQEIGEFISQMSEFAIENNSRLQLIKNLELCIQYEEILKNESSDLLKSLKNIHAAIDVKLQTISFQEVSQAELNYKNNPSEMTFKQLNIMIIEFRKYSENVKERKDVDEIEKHAEKSNKLITQIANQLFNLEKDFENNFNRSFVKKFEQNIQSYEEFQQVYHTEYSDKYKQLMQFIQKCRNLKEFQVAIDSFETEHTDFAVSSFNIQILLQIGTNKENLIKIDSSTNDWKKTDVDSESHSSKKIKFIATDDIDGSLTISLTSQGWVSTKGETEIDFYKIVARASKEGQSKYILKVRPNNNEDEPYAQVALSFEDLPVWNGL